MNTVYLNWNGPVGKETVDEFTRGVDTPLGWNDFHTYIREIVNEYHLAGMNVYISTRPCKNWNIDENS